MPRRKVRKTKLGLNPRFGLWPNVLGEARTRGEAPFLSLQRTARQSLASHRGGEAAELNHLVRMSQAFLSVARVGQLATIRSPIMT